MKEETFQLTAQKCQWSKRLLRAPCANGQDDFEENDRFLEAHNLPRPNREETENPNRPIARKEVERLLKNVLIQKSLGAGDFIGAPWQTFKEGWTPTLLKPFKKKKKKKRRERFQTRFTRPALPWHWNQTRSRKPNKTTKKHNYRSVSPMSTDAKILNKTLANNSPIHEKDQTPLSASCQMWQTTSTER